MIDPNELAADLQSAIEDFPTLLHWVEGEVDFSGIMSPLRDQSILIIGGEKPGIHFTVTTVPSVFGSTMPVQDDHFTLRTGGAEYKVEYVTSKQNADPNNPNQNVLSPFIRFNVVQHE